MRTRNFLNYILSFLLFVVLSSCGLYNSPYLDAPSVKIFESGSGNAEIYNRSDNDPDIFRGYEIYYKYYDNSSEIADDDKAIFNTSEPKPDDLTSVGYRRVYNVLTTDLSTSYPLVAVDYSDRDSSFTLTVYFDEVSSVEAPPYVQYSGYSNVDLYRQETENNNTGTGKMEYETFIPRDHDPAETEIDRTSTNKTLSLYVFAYGKDDQVYNIYSKPVWLGYITYS